MPVTIRDLEAARIAVIQAETNVRAAEARLNRSTPLAYVQSRVDERHRMIIIAAETARARYAELEEQYLRENPSQK